MSGDSFFGWHTIFDEGGDSRTPYMTRIWAGRLRLHIFYRGDADPDCHDHPWDFWTFPLTPYVEAVVLPRLFAGHGVIRRVVPAFRLHFRPAEHTHRVLGRWIGPGLGHRNAYPAFREGKIVTVVWRSATKRKWGFLKNRDGAWCWVPWKEYIFGGGRAAPCAPNAGRTYPCNPILLPTSKVMCPHSGQIWNPAAFEQPDCPNCKAAWQELEGSKQ